jgi:polyisoprenoid-binding protein YceI
MFKKITVLGITLFVLCFSLVYAIEKLNVDRNHSTMGFNVPIMGGLSKVTGKFTDFEVNADWNDADPSTSTVTVTIQTASVSTGIDKRDGHLKSADFFDAENFPTITFVSSSITGSGSDYEVSGQFTMRGVTKDITLNMKKEEIPSPDGQSVWRAFMVTGSLNRTDYGVSWENPQVPGFVGDVIDMDIVILTK